MKNSSEFGELIHNPLFNQIMDGLDDVVIIIDENTKVIYVNKTYERVFRHKCSSILGKLLSSIEGEETTAIQALKLGIPISHQLQKLNSADLNTVGVSFPLHNGKDVVGSVSIFDSTKKFVDLADKLQKSKKMNAFLKEQLDKNAMVSSNFITINSEMVKSIQFLRKAAQFNSTVLLRGESGTGKEVLSKELHYNSNRRDRRFIKVNCAAIPDDLLESELFGYEGGAFTGAKKCGKPGKFELAQGGTIFLDEIGDMGFNMQAKLLRVLQEKEIERVGGTTTIPLDVRVIAATNQDLRKLIEEGKFRQDLYYRINVIEVFIPPLRDRKDDILPLTEHFLKKFAPDEVITVSDEALEILQSHDWPGNVRELQNVLEYSFVMRENSVIDVEALPNYMKVLKPVASHAASTPAPVLKSDTTDLCEVPDIHTNTSNLEKELIIAAIKKHRNKSKAIEELGISRSNFYKKLKMYHIDL